MDQESAFVQAFIIPDKQARYLSMLSSRKRRGGFLDRLNHHLDVDYSFAVQVPASEQTAMQIGKMLRARGATDRCHVISANSEWDNLEMALGEALELVCGSSIGTILCCTPGRLAYYEAEDQRRRYILRRMP
jgi:hypothetical protein